MKKNRITSHFDCCSGLYCLYLVDISTAEVIMAEININGYQAEKIISEWVEKESAEETVLNWE